MEAPRDARANSASPRRPHLARRRPTPDETALVERLYQKQLGKYLSSPEAAGKVIRNGESAPRAGLDEHVDAVPLELAVPQRPLIKGDARCHAIAAASILAKTTRDALMLRYDDEYPGYGFALHKGYPTEAHRDAIRRLGPCPIHRRTFTLLPPPTLFE